MKTNFFNKRRIDSENIRSFIDDTEKQKYTNVSRKHFMTLREIVSEFGNNIPLSLSQGNNLTYNHDLENPMTRKHFDLSDLPGMRETEEANTITRENLKKLERLKSQQVAEKQRIHSERLAKLDKLNDSNSSVEPEK